jgi:hypothetical protein
MLSSGIVLDDTGRKCQGKHGGLHERGGRRPKPGEVLGCSCLINSAFAAVRESAAAAH